MAQINNKFISELSLKPWALSLLATICLILGIVLQSPYFIVLPLPILFIKKISTKTKIIPLLFFCLGTLINRPNFPNIEIENKKGSLSGAVIDITENQMRQFIYSYKIDGLFNNQAGRYVLYAKEDLSLCCGDSVIIYSLKASKSTSEEFNKYLKKEGITDTFFSKKPRLKIYKQGLYGLFCISHQLKTGLLRRIKQKLSPQSFCLFSSIFLGNRSECAKEYEDLRPCFKYWGLSHLLARSGLHLIIFILTMAAFLSIATGFYTQQITRLALVVAYYLLSWPSASFNRAFLFFMLWQLCNLLRLQKNNINLLNIVTISTLLRNPTLIFFVDFQLSFLLAYALAFLFESNSSIHKIS
jgi:ComEC/Rec2-related protein